MVVGVGMEGEHKKIAVQRQLAKKPKAKSDLGKAFEGFIARHRAPQKVARVKKKR